MNSQIKAYMCFLLHFLEDSSPQLRMKCMCWKNAEHFVSFMPSPSAKWQWHMASKELKRITWYTWLSVYLHGCIISWTFNYGVNILCFLLAGSFSWAGDYSAFYIQPYHFLYGYLRVSVQCVTNILLKIICNDNFFSEEEGCCCMGRHLYVLHMVD